MKLCLMLKIYYIHNVNMFGTGHSVTTNQPTSPDINTHDENATVCGIIRVVYLVRR